MAEHILDYPGLIYYHGRLNSFIDDALSELLPKDEEGKILYVYAGQVDNFSDLPTDAEAGDVYNVVNADPDNKVKAGDNIAWTGTEWDDLSGYIDTSIYEKYADALADKEELLAQVNGMLDDYVSEESFDETMSNYVKEEDFDLERIDDPDIIALFENGGGVTDPEPEIPYQLTIKFNTTSYEGFDDYDIRVDGTFTGVEPAKFHNDADDRIDNPGNVFMAQVPIDEISVTIDEISPNAEFLGLTYEGTTLTFNFNYLNKTIDFHCMVGEEEFGDIEGDISIGVYWDEDCTYQLYNFGEPVIIVCSAATNWHASFTTSYVNMGTKMYLAVRSVPDGYTYSTAPVELDIDNGPISIILSGFRKAGGR